MSKQYQTDNNQRANNSQRLLIGLPLTVTLLFCFGFVAVSPGKDQATISASTKNGKSKSTKPAPLPPLPTSVAVVQTLDVAATPGSATPSTSPTNTSSPQPSSAATTSATNPRAAKPVSQNPQAPASTQRQTITKQQNISVTNTLRKVLNR